MTTNSKDTHNKQMEKLRLNSVFPRTHNISTAFYDHELAAAITDTGHHLMNHLMDKLAKDLFHDLNG